jgi:XTP/dITP diphosphohydrolase
MEFKRLIVASGNAHKIQEIRDIFAGSGMQIVSMTEAGFKGDIEENGKTFKENAYIKAKHICDLFGEPALADDSGLCVDILCGAPGIYSARFSGEGDKGNRALLLKRMDGLANRRAHFECAVCLVTPDGKVLFGEGQTRGRILCEEIGDNGFGYDSLFYSNDLGKSFGVATEQEKNGVSHRFRALQDLRSKL